MKTQRPRRVGGGLARRRVRGGYATVVTLALAVLMVMFVVSGQRTLSRLKREVRLLEERQLKHWDSGSGTNRVAVRPTPPESEAKE